jgi:hypothetical protein
MIEYLKKRYNIIVKDNEKFYKFYKKKFPVLYYLLPTVQILSLMAMLYYFKILSIDYVTVYQSTLDSELINIDKSLLEMYREHLNLFWISSGLYFSSVLSTLIINLYVIYRANSPIDDRLFQVAKHGAKAIGALTVGSVGYSYAPIEPNVVSNFVHTKTLFGRGYDYEVGSLVNKFKGDIISSGLGRETMLEAVNKHGSDSKILDSKALNDIVADEDYSTKLRAQLSFPESRVIGLPIVDLKTSSINLTDLNNLEVANERKESPFFDHSDMSFDDEVQKEKEPTSFRNLKQDQDFADAKRRGITRTKRVTFDDSDDSNF